MPELAKALNRIATAMEAKQEHPLLAFPTIQDLQEWLTKETVLKHASEDELFALFHTFKEYLKELWANQGKKEDIVFLDSDLGKVIKKLKANYK